MKYASILLLLLGTLLQGACSTQAVYTGESFSSDSPFRMRAEGDVAMGCESARRALLGQGYLIESATAESVKGRKAYKTEDTQNTFIEMTIVCLGEISGSTLYANGVLTTYALKKSTSSASVGLSALGSISLPIGQSADSLVKVSEETIDDKEFYKRFFSAVDIILGEMRATRETAAQNTAEPAPQPAAPTAAAPGPSTTQTAPAVQQAPAPVPATTTAPTPAAVVAPVPAPTPATAPAVSATAVETVPAPSAPITPAQPAAAAPPVASDAAAVAVPPSAEEELQPFPTRAAPEPAPAPQEPGATTTQTVPDTELQAFPVPGNATSP